MFFKKRKESEILNSLKILSMLYSYSYLSRQNYWQLLDFYKNNLVFILACSNSHFRIVSWFFQYSVRVFTFQDMIPSMSRSPFACALYRCWFFSPKPGQKALVHCPLTSISSSQELLGQSKPTLGRSTCGIGIMKL